MDEIYVKAELSGSAVRDYMAYTANEQIPTENCSI